MRTAIHGSEEEQRSFTQEMGIMASRAGLRELALEIWRTGSKLPGGGVFVCNEAVELSSLGGAAGSVEVAARMPMNQPRSYTVLGNIRRDAGQPLAAVDAYRLALKHDERFFLPVSNGIQFAIGLVNRLF